MENLFNEELLIRCLTETVTAEENMQVEQWCAMSDENQKILEQLYFTLQVSNHLRVIQSVNHNEALCDLKDRIEKKEKSIRRKILIRRFQQIAAILFLPVLLLSFWLFLQTNGIPPKYIELRSNPGMVSTFELPDGSKVWLNGGSYLRYPHIFRSKNREVEMSGQAYFEIVPNAQQPFLVKANESFSLEVLGTSFNLTAYKDEDIIETTLVEGSVRLMLLQDGKIVQHMMKTNEKVVYIKDKELKSEKTVTSLPNNHPVVSSTNIVAEIKSEPVKIETVDPKYDIAWKDHQILFKNHPMEEVIRTLGRYYNVQFVVKNNEVMNPKITGKFNNEQLPQVMEYLRIASGIKYNIEPALVEDGEIKPEVVEIWK